MSGQTTGWRDVLAQAERDANEALLDAIEAIEEARRQLDRMEAAGMGADLGPALKVLADMHEWSTAHAGWASEDPA